MNKVVHFITHLLQLNTGQVISKIDSKGNIWVAFKCGTCGKIQDPYLARKVINPL